LVVEGNGTKDGIPPFFGAPSHSGRMIALSLNQTAQDTLPGHPGGVTFACPALSIAAHDPSSVLPFLPALLVFAGVGAVVASHRSANPLGWLMLGMSGMSIGLLAAAYAKYGLTRTPYAAGTAWAAWVFMVCIEVGTIPLIFILLLFPHGRLLSPRWRVVAWAAVMVPIVGGVLTAVSDVNYSDRTNFPMLRDPVRLVPRSTAEPIYSVYQFVILVVILAAAASLVLRFRRSGGEERQQLKWIAFAGGLAAAGFIVLASLPNGPEPVLAFITLVPLIAVAVGIAVLKFRLYDIDVVINKTVVYGALAAFTTAVYVGIVVGIGALVGQGSSPNLGLSILATAVVAVAFGPVRSRVQHVANRLVYGQRATPYEVLSEFGSRMAGAYPSEDLLPRMAQILAEGTGAAEATVWLRDEGKFRPAAAWPLEADEPQPLIVPNGEDPTLPPPARMWPVRHREELLGALSLRKPPGERLTPSEDHLARDLASGAGLVLRNVRLIEDLRASRQRLVTAQDAERRRIERNIHDGAQQQLVALAVKLGLAESLVVKDSSRTRALLAELRADSQSALEDLRDLARGVYPPLLSDRGLAPGTGGTGPEVPSRRDGGDPRRGKVPARGGVRGVLLLPGGPPERREVLRGHRGHYRPVRDRRPPELRGPRRRGRLRSGDHHTRVGPHQHGRSPGGPGRRDRGPLQPGSGDGRGRAGPDRRAGGGGMRPQRATILAWSSWAIALGTVITYIVIGLVSPSTGVLSGEPGRLAPAIATMAFIVGFATVGALVASKLPTRSAGFCACPACASSPSPSPSSSATAEERSATWATGSGAGCFCQRVVPSDFQWDLFAMDEEAE